MADIPRKAVLDPDDDSETSGLSNEFRYLIDALPDGVLVTDKIGQIAACNLAAERLFGRKASEIVNTDMVDLFKSASEDERAMIAGIFAKELTAAPIEALATTKCGSSIPISLSLVLARGAPDRYLVITRDITQRQQAAEQLTRAQQELQLTFHHAPIGMATIDLSGKIASINQALCSMLGYEENELIDVELATLTHPDDAITAKGLKRLLLDGKKPFVRQDKRYLKRDGSLVFGIVRYSLVRDSAGKPLLIVAQIVNRTDQMKAEREIRQHRESLVEVARLGTMGEMAAGIAHELNQPLTAISNYAQACQRLIHDDAITADDLDGIMAKIKVQARRASQVISGLRSFVKKRQVTRRPTDIHRLLSEVVMMAELDTNANGIPLNLDIARSLPQVQADPVQLQQVLLNLIRNAIDAMLACEDRDAGIRISARAVKDDDVVISVEDHGPGVSDEIGARLFDPFFTTKKDGLGIGLSFSKSIVEDHGGDLAFGPGRSGGAIFSVTLPTLLEH
jgi:two-component system sensor kinase FixL